MKALYVLLILISISSLTFSQMPLCFNFSPYYKDGQDPRVGSDIPPEQIVQALEAIKPYCNCIRTFASQAPLDTVPYIAKAMGFSTVIVGAWLDSDTTSNMMEIDRVIQLALDGVVDRVVIGSETLLRGDLTPQELVEYISYVKEQLPNIPVTTADVYGTLLANPEVIDAVDFIFYNSYPFWEGVNIHCAIYSFHESYMSIKAVAGNKDIWISETGWPTEGNTVGDAIPGIENMQFYLRHIRAWGTFYNIPVYWFGAFDEPWKFNAINPQEAYWGLITYDEDTNSLVYKPGVVPILSEIVNIDTAIWTCIFLPNTTNEPQIEITEIPIYGDQNGFVCGIVDGIRPCDYNLVMYILVNDRWWIKPTFDEKLTRISCDGSFCVDVVTGGLDRFSTQYYLALIPKDWDPPCIGNSPMLPDSLYENAITDVDIFRTPFAFGGMGVMDSELDVIRPSDTISNDVYVENIEDVLFFKGSIDISSTVGPNFIDVHNIYDESNWDISIVDSRNISFTYNQPDNTIPFSIPDSTVVFTIKSMMSTESEYCRRIRISDETLPLEVIHFVDNQVNPVALQKLQSSLICPAAPLFISMEGPDELYNGQQDQVSIVADKLAFVNSFEFLIEADEGLSIIQMDSLYIDEGLTYEILGDSILHIRYNSIDGQPLQDWFDIDSICSFQVKAVANVIGCKELRFNRDTMFLNASKFIQGETQNAFIDTGNELEYCSIATNVDAVENDLVLTIYPNPLERYQTLHLEIDSELSKTPYVLKIFDAYGRKMSEDEILETQAFEIEELSKSGLYFISLFDRNGSLLTSEKIIVN